MIKLNLMQKSSAYIVDSVSLWHGRSRYVNFNSIKNMYKLGLISDSDFDSISKCQIYVQAKMHRKSFKFIERKKWVAWFGI